MNSLRVGKSFVHPAFDLLLIGGGLSLIVAGANAVGVTRALLPIDALSGSFPFVLLGVNLAHFAASTVRLYSKRGASEELPFVSLGLPVVTLAVLLGAIAFAENLGTHLTNLYLTWSPYHYAAQSYGLAMMYAYRSGSALNDRDRLLLRATCLAPFLYAFFKGPTVGIEWLMPASLLESPVVAPVRAGLVQALAIAALGTPPLLLWRSIRLGQSLPLISVLTMVANACWWITPQYLDAVVWVPIFHGLQYLAIVSIFHVRERLREPGNARGWVYHSAWFYGACVLLAYLLFNVWPYAFVAMGFGMGESVLLVIAIINIHHFIVDAYIWRLRRDPNYRVVTDTPSTAVAPLATAG